MNTHKTIRRTRSAGVKVKIGTILDTGVLEKLRMRAARDHKPISTIIEEAVLRFEEADATDYALLLRALESVLALRFSISGDDLRSIMEEDYYNQ